MLIIKVCGLKFPENIEEIKNLNIDWMGFIFYKPSSRYSENHYKDKIEGKTKIGVFVNDNIDEITNKIKEYNLNGIQLHGDENPEFCKYFKNNNILTIKAFGIDKDFDFDELKLFENVIDYFLFDTKTVLYGGSGKKFNWDFLNKYKLKTPFILSGGININDVDNLKKINHKQFFGVDLNSGFEISAGLKDSILINNFIKKLK